VAHRRATVILSAICTLRYPPAEIAEKRMGVFHEDIDDASKTPQIFFLAIAGQTDFSYK